MSRQEKRLALVAFVVLKHKVVNMLRGLLFVRMKAAEQALRDGRLDDAHRMAQEPEIAGHARGAKLLASLGKALVERARNHYRADRFTEALLDLGKADGCGGMKAEIAELRNQVTTVAREVARQDEERRRKLEEARRRIYGGSIAAGRMILENADQQNTQFQQLKKEAADREQEFKTLMARAEASFKRNEFDAAVDALLQAKKLDAHSEQATTLERKICDQLLKQARQSFDAGRVAMAMSDVDRLKSLGSNHASKTELLEIVHLSAAAGRALDAWDIDATQRHLHRMKALSPKIAWVNKAIDQIARLDAALLNLKSSPLGEYAKMPSSTDNAPASLQETMILGTPDAPGRSGLPRQLLLLVNGGGSYLLHLASRASIGRATAAESIADIPIFSDLSSHHADLTRVEEDYFIISPHDVEVAGRPTRQHLLRDGDRVVLARRAKFTVRVPNRKSPSVRLDISDSTKMPHDVRRVVLFKQTAMIGRGSNCHVTCRSAARDLVLFERGGKLWVRPQGRDNAGNNTIEVQLGKSIEVEGAEFVLEPWSTDDFGSSKIV